MMLGGTNATLKQTLHQITLAEGAKRRWKDAHIITRKVSGSQLYFEWILENTEDHIVLIQERWRLPGEIESWKSAAFRKGWT
eukprot:8853373-Heterocapsa_arctica.AAC.1